jgi:ADP-dependent NAD(P)H-hydrate dehydratase / NAD(P)H-hydrate epimerase
MDPTVQLEPLYTAEEMRAAEAGHDVQQLMELAGAAVARSVLERYPEAEEITVVAGGGANGGDARIAGRLLAEAGKEVAVVDAKVDPPELGAPDVVVDGLFGTGFSGEPRAEALAFIESINAADEIVSVDLPSGVDASTGEVAVAAVQSDHVVTFHARKVGLEVTPGGFHAPSVEVVDIGLGGAHRTRSWVATADLVKLVFPRNRYDNKYTAGSVLVVGGSPGYTGALCLAARAAFRADAGYVAVAAPDASLPIVEQQLLEAVKRPLAAVGEAAERAGAVAIGPGLGRGDEEAVLVRRLLGTLDQPIVLDADALFELEPFSRDATTVLTPHEGELARLIGRDAEWIAEHRLRALREAVERFACIVVLKGATTLIGGPVDDGVLTCRGPASLAVAGTGDVLTGVVAAFLAKLSALSPLEAVAAAVVAHAEAARAVEHQRGLIASDVIEALPRVLG